MASKLLLNSVYILGAIKMKKIIIGFLVTWASISYSQDFNLSLEHFEDYKSEKLKENRALEGTSPILGHDLVTKIKDANIHPEIIYKAILEQNPDFDTKIHKSSIAYFRTMTPGLDNYCSKNKISTRMENGWTQVEHAAIPQEIIRPLTNKYLNNINEIFTTNLSTENIIRESKQLGKNFQEKRYNCPVVKKLENLENKLGKICLGLGFCLRAKKINSIISSAEAAYPRTQFGINGFTRYVYDELYENTNLQEDLKIIYDLEIEWLSKANSGQAPGQFFEYVIDNAIEKEMHVKDVMLILAYSMRNMPSLDIEYTEDPKKALLIETYFWGFKDLRNELYKNQYSENIFPDYKFKRNPGFYHYLTAALLGCEARLAGQPHFIAKMLGILSKVGYKTDKLIKAIDKEHYSELKLGGKYKYVRSIMKKQGFGPGVKAGEQAAKYGSRVCGAFKKSLRKDYRQKKRDARKETESRREFRKVKAELKKELKDSYRSILD